MHKSEKFFLQKIDLAAKEQGKILTKEELNFLIDDYFLPFLNRPPIIKDLTQWTQNLGKSLFILYSNELKQNPIQQLWLSMMQDLRRKSKMSALITVVAIWFTKLLGSVPAEERPYLDKYRR